MPPRRNNHSHSQLLLHYYTTTANSSSVGEATSSITGDGFSINSNGLIWVDGTINFSEGPYWTTKVQKKKNGIHPELYFKYIKSKFGILERMKLDRRIARLEKAFDKAADAGQYILAEKFLNDVGREVRESMIYAKGVRFFLERDDIEKHRHHIRDGRIADTRLEDYTRVIPKAVLAKKKKVEGVFDGFVVYHYWNEEVEEKVKKNERMSREEESKMRDPVLFGRVKECNRLYFVADWEDEYCDLTFDEIIGVVGKEDEEITLTHQPKV